MSKAFQEKFGNKKYKREDIRNFNALLFPVDENGKPLYVTEQGHKDECDVNNIIKKYDRTGLINHVSRFEAMYGDVGSLEFREALDLQIRVGQNFNELPSEIRKRFNNDPASFLAFLENPKNNAEAVELGLRNKPSAPTIKLEASKLQEGVQSPSENK
ncbi:MAG: internal scaffolding protein [Microvirus sp.]|nr:MAG: internal scaffolding protein [Microvirus sp.]